MDAGGMLATVTEYEALIEALKARKVALGITNATLEELTGLQSGYVGTLFGSARSRSLGGTSFGLILAGLAVKLVLVEDLDAARRMEKRWEQRIRPLPVAKPVSTSGEDAIFIERFRTLGRMGGMARSHRLSPAARRRAAQAGARARWRKKKGS